MKLVSLKITWLIIVFDHHEMIYVYVHWRGELLDKVTVNSEFDVISYYFSTLKKFPIILGNYLEFYIKEIQCLESHTNIKIIFPVNKFSMNQNNLQTVYCPRNVIKIMVKFSGLMLVQKRYGREKILCTHCIVWTIRTHTVARYIHPKPKRSCTLFTRVLY